jgi:sRNA-binding carbon storage regulator CsrA
MHVTFSPRQSVCISLAPDTDPLTPIAVLFKEGPLRARVTEMGGLQVGIAVQAPPALQVYCEDIGGRSFGQCAVKGKNHGVFLLSRQLRDSVALSLEGGAAPTMPIGRLFRKGPVELHVIEMNGRHVRLGIRAPRVLHIHRREVPERTGKEKTMQYANDIERSVRTVPSTRSPLQPVPQELLAGGLSPHSASQSWIRPAPPDL